MAIVPRVCVCVLVNQRHRVRVNVSILSFRNCAISNRHLRGKQTMKSSCQVGIEDGAVFSGAISWDPSWDTRALARVRRFACGLWKYMH